MVILRKWCLMCRHTGATYIALLAYSYVVVDDQISYQIVGIFLQYCDACIILPNGWLQNRRNFSSMYYIKKISAKCIHEQLILGDTLAEICDPPWNPFTTMKPGMFHLDVKPL